MPQLIDQYGNPLRRELLTRDVAAPTLMGVRQPQSGYPGDGLTPLRLAEILRQADIGEVLAYFELAEQIEERDLHYSGVLSARKRAVTQIDVTVEAASDDAEDVRRADMVREWLKRDELTEETFDILDAVGKGVSFTEIVWDTSEGQWYPKRLERRDPRFFKPDRDGSTFLLRGGIEGNGQEEPLPAFKFIELRIKAKSGLPVRSGIARLAAWNWMFKAFTLRDWAVFTQTYGQPIRVGRYHPGASEEDRNTLYRAVANIAGDCAAIIPQGMEMDFIEAKNIGPGSDLYEKRADWLDRQMSKAVLGQTNTTDAQAGGIGSSQAQVHNDVREDIETADCKALSAALNRDLVRPWCDLEFGPPGAGRGYPRVVIARPRKEDLQQLSASLAQLVPLGLRVQQSEIRDKFGLSEPDRDADVLRPPSVEAGALPALPAPPSQDRITLQSRQTPSHPAAQIADRMARNAEQAMEDILGTIEAMMASASDMSELRGMITSAFGEIDSSLLADAIEDGMVAAHAAGRSDLEDESKGR